MIRRLIGLFGAVAVALLLLAPAASAQYVGPADVTNPPAVDDTGVEEGTASLPRTGSDSTGTLWRVAVVLVAAGGLLVLTARHRAADQA